MLFCKSDFNQIYSVICQTRFKSLRKKKETGILTVSGVKRSIQSLCTESKVCLQADVSLCTIRETWEYFDGEIRDALESF